MVKRGAEFHFFRTDGMRVPEVNDHLKPGELAAELGAGVELRGTASFGSTGVPAWRLPHSRGFNRTGSRRRADWEAFVSALQR